jgi:adenosine/AMP kinase
LFVVVWYLAFTTHHRVGRYTVHVKEIPDLEKKMFGKLSVCASFVWYLEAGFPVDLVDGSKIV